MNRDRLLQRFLRYVQVDTTAQPDAEDYPSSPGQLELGRLLAQGASGPGPRRRLPEPHGIVLATVPATVATAQPPPSPCAPTSILRRKRAAAGVKPQVIAQLCRRRPGPARRSEPGDPRGRQPRNWNRCCGRTIITSDGTTLLGADDKAGVAVIMETAAWLIEHPEIAARPDPPLLHLRRRDRPRRRPSRSRIGSGRWCATRWTVTAADDDRRGDLFRRSGPGDDPRRQHSSVDRQGPHDQRRARGRRFHPRLPRDVLSPETTDGREGFLHPYDLHGGVAEMQLKILLRDFQDAEARRAGRAAAAAAAATDAGVSRGHYRRVPSTRSTATWPKG